MQRLPNDPLAPDSAEGRLQVNRVVSNESGIFD